MIGRLVNSVEKSKHFPIFRIVLRPTENSSERAFHRFKIGRIGRVNEILCRNEVARLKFPDRCHTESGSEQCIRIFHSGTTMEFLEFFDADQVCRSFRPWQERTRHLRLAPRFKKPILPFHELLICNSVPQSRGKISFVDSSRPCAERIVPVFRGEHLIENRLFARRNIGNVLYGPAPDKLNRICCKVYFRKTIHRSEISACGKNMRIFRNGLAFPCRINQKFTRNRIISECFPRNLYDCFPAFRLPEYGAFPDSVPFPGRAVGISRNALIKQAVKMRTGRINGKVPAGIFAGSKRKSSTQSSFHTGPSCSFT